MLIHRLNAQQVPGEGKNHLTVEIPLGEEYGKQKHVYGEG